MPEDTLRTHTPLSTYFTATAPLGCSKHIYHPLFLREGDTDVAQSQIRGYHTSLHLRPSMLRGASRTGHDDLAPARQTTCAIKSGESSIIINTHIHKRQ